MRTRFPRIPATGVVSLPTSDVQSTDPSTRSLATRDREVIRRWAERHHAEPATGEATESGPATLHVNDGGAGVRFNFPALSRFRPITWDEWFDHMARHHLVFVYEEEVSDRAYELWQSRGGDHGGDQEDWFEAERHLRPTGGPHAARYRFIQQVPDES